MQELKEMNWQIRKPKKHAQAAELNLDQFLSNAKRKLRKIKDIDWQLKWQKETFSGAAKTYVELGPEPTSCAKIPSRTETKKRGPRMAYCS